MKQFEQQLLVRICILDVRLRCCAVRLQDHTDVEALHDLRICLRSGRSLLRPMRGLPGVDLLEQAAAAVGRLTNPIRELQVFVAQLNALGMPDVARQRSRGLQPALVQLQSCEELPHLLQLLDGFPALWRLAAREGCMRGLRRHIGRRLESDMGKISHSPHTAPEDLHALRLRVKRLRYASEAYPVLTPLNRRQLGLLRQLQQALGDWNDCQQWLECSLSDWQLAECRPIWLDRAQAAKNQADILLQRFEQISS